MHRSRASNERNVVLLTGIGRFAAHFFELMFPTLAVTLASDTGAPIERVLGWSFLAYLLYGLGAVPFAILAERIGARVLIISGIFGMGIFAIGTGEANHGTALAICLAGMGLCASIHYPVGTALISRSVAQPGRALAISGIFGHLAMALTPIVTAYLCEQAGWRATYGMVGYAACALAVACAFIGIDEPRDGDARAIAAPPRRAAAARSANLFILLLAAAALAGVAYRGSTLIQPAYFDARVSALGYGAATSLVYLLGIGGHYLGGMLADRHDLRWLYFGFHAVSLPALIGMAAVADLPLIVLASVFVFFSLGMQPIEDSLVAHVTPPRWRATAHGLKLTLTFGVGSLAVWIVEWAAQLGLSFAIVCLAGVLFVQLVVVAAFLSLSWGREFRNTDDAADTPSTLLTV